MTNFGISLFINLVRFARWPSRMLVMIMAISILAAPDILAQSTADVCGETKKVLGQYERERAELGFTLGVKGKETMLRDFLSRLNKAIANGTLVDNKTLEVVVINLEEKVKVGRLTVEQRRELQRSYRNRIASELQKAAALTNQELLSRIERVDNEISTRRNRMTNLDCDEAGEETDDSNGQNWAGTWINSNGLETVKVSGSSIGITATFTYQGGDFKGNGTWSDCSASAATLVCSWQARHDDSTKSGERSGQITLTLSGNTMDASLTEAAPKWNYKPGFSAQNVMSAMFAGKVWKMRYSRQ